MTFQEQDPDVVRWGLHHLMEVCSVTNGGSPAVFTHYDKDISSVEYVSEGYCVPNYVNVENDEISNYVENDEMIAQALQEELSRLALEENHGSSGNNQQKESVLAQDWVSPSQRHDNFTTESRQDQDYANEMGTSNSLFSTEERSGDDEDQSCSPEMADESTLDGEVGKRINQMVPIRVSLLLGHKCQLHNSFQVLKLVGCLFLTWCMQHVPKVNGEVPSADEATSDHQRLMNRSFLLYS